MKKIFKQFLENIKLTTAQKDDAKTKYTGVCKTLHATYYTSKYSGDSKLLFGSYKTKTNIRPITDDQDVDVLFKIPIDVYEKYDNYIGNGQSALLQEIRKTLKDTYTMTDKISGWGKVVLVNFDGKHNVEILPAFECEDGTFLIPNTVGDGSWEVFDPKKQISEFEDSNSKTNGATRVLCRIGKTWRDNTVSAKSCYSSFNLQNDVINYFVLHSKDDDYPYMIKNYFEYLYYRCSDDIKSNVETARNRAIKALEYFENDDFINASLEYKKIFGDVFPKVDKNPQKDNCRFHAFSNPSKPYGGR